MPADEKAEAGAAPGAPAIERTRADAVRFAIANTEIEGLHASKAAEALLNRWADGELDDDELMAAALDNRRGAPSPE